MKRHCDEFELDHNDNQVPKKPVNSQARVYSEIRNDYFSELLTLSNGRSGTAPNNKGIYIPANTQNGLGQQQLPLTQRPLPLAPHVHPTLTINPVPTSSPMAVDDVIHADHSSPRIVSPSSPGTMSPMSLESSQSRLNDGEEFCYQIDDGTVETWRLSVFAMLNAVLSHEPEGDTQSTGSFSGTSAFSNTPSSSSGHMTGSTCRQSSGD